MPLFGSLQTMSLPDLLQWLGSSRKTGTLQVENNRVQKWILFEEGQIVGCSSDDPPERLGQFLLSRGKITEDQLRIALAAQEGSGKHLGKLFVEMGALTREELSSHLDAKAEETIYSVFDWEDAVFRFHEQVTDHPNIFPVALKVDEVLLRGMQRLDEIQRIRTVFNDPGIVLRHTTTVPPAQVLDNKMARTLYDTINGERSVAEILLHVHGSEYLVTKFLYELYRNDFLEIVGVKRVDEPHAAEGDVATGPSVELDPSISLPEAPAAQAEPPLVAPVPATDAPGHYRMQAGGGTAAVDRGFSVNLEPRATELARTDAADLEAVFGPHDYQVARRREEITFQIDRGRSGRELYPYLILMMVIVLALEHVVSNRFYRDDEIDRRTTWKWPKSEDQATYQQQSESIPAT